MSTYFASVFPVLNFLAVFWSAFYEDSHFIDKEIEA